MGKRQIGELQPSELVVAIMISDLVSVPMSDNAIPLLYGIVPMFTLVFSVMIVMLAKMKLKMIRHGLEDEEVKKEYRRGRAFG